MEKVTTLVLTRDGRPHLMSDAVSLEDARRWAEEGYLVFRFAARKGLWAMNCVNSGNVFNDEGASEKAREAFLLLSDKGV